MSISVASILKGVVGDLASVNTAWLELVLSGISLNSTQVSLGGAFIAVPGVSRDGRDYIDACVNANIIFAHGDTVSGALSANNIPVLTIPNLDEKVSVLAGNFYGNPSEKINVIGVTGTNGKTTCTHFLSQVISKCVSTCAHMGTLGGGIFTAGKHSVLQQTGMTTPSPIVVQKMLASFSKNSEYAAMEVSSHGLAQFRTSGVHYKGAVFTNLSRDHLDFHTTFDNYFAAKARLFFEYNLEFAVINIDDEWGQKIADRLGHLNIKVYGVTQKEGGFKSSVNTELVVASNISINENGLSADVASPWGESHINTGLFGRYNAINIALVIASACALGLKFVDVIAAINMLSAVPGRLQKITSEYSDKAPAVFVDFAHTPDAVKNVLSEIKSLCVGQLWVVIGCGGDRDKGKRVLMAEAAIENADKCIFTSDNPRSENPQSILKDMTKTLSSNLYHLIENRKKAIEFAVNNAKAQDTIVIAGKGHEKFQIIKEEKIPFDDVLIAQEMIAAKSVLAEVRSV